MRGFERKNEISPTYFTFSLTIIVTRLCQGLLFTTKDTKNHQVNFEITKNHQINMLNTKLDNSLDFALGFVLFHFVAIRWVA